jgi:hypothetical protein
MKPPAYRRQAYVDRQTERIDETNHADASQVDRATENRRKTMTKDLGMRILVGTAILGTALSLTGCISPTKVAGAVTAPSTAATTAATTPTVAATTATPTPTKASTYKFGDTVSWEATGVSLTLSAPVPYKPSKYAIVPAGTSPVVFAITLKNGGTEAFDPGMVYMTASSGEAEAQSVFDSPALVGGPTTKLLPGKSVTWKVGFGVLNAADITAEITPSVLYDSAIFTS